MQLSFSVLSALSFVSLPLVLIPLPWHIRARNIATISIAVNLFLVNLIRGIDSVVWRHNVVVRWIPWCDITTKYIIGATIVLPATSLCITRHLEQVASVRSSLQTATDKKRRQIFEAFMCIGLPIIIMGLHYIVQGHRFDIIEDEGCAASIYFSIPAIIILYLPPIILSTMSAVYGAMAFYWFMKRRANFAAHLQSGESGLNSSRYIRLMGLAIVEILLSNGLGLYIWVVNQTALPLRVWDNWNDVHWNFSRIDQYPRALLPEVGYNRTAVVWMAPIIGSFIFFIFFAFGQETIAEYRKGVFWFRKSVLRHDVSTMNASVSVLPTYSAPSRVRAVRLDEWDNDSIEEKIDRKDGYSRQSSATFQSTTVSTMPDAAGEPSSPVRPPSPAALKPVDPEKAV